MADNVLFKFEGAIPQPSLLSSALYAIKRIFSSAPEMPDPPVPYDLVQYSVSYKEIEGGNILNTEAYRYNLQAELSKSPGIQENINLKKPDPAAINEAFNANAPKELKPGEVIKVKDGEISYEEFVQIDHNVDNVSPNDASFGKKMPKIFIFQNFLPEKIAQLPILENINQVTGNNLHYYNSHDLILGGQEFFATHTKEEIKALFAHETGHRILIATQGLDIVAYSAEKHAALMGENFSETCGNTNGSNLTYGCYQLIQKLNGETDSVILKIGEKINELQRGQEKLADKYATLAGYGNGGIILNLQDYFGPTDSTHPLGKDRIKNIEMIMADPAAAREQLETELAKLKKPALPVIDAGIEIKTPAPAPTQVSLAEQPNQTR